MLNVTGDNGSFYRCLINSSVLIAVFAAANAFYVKWAQRRKETRRNELLAPYITDSDDPKDGGEKAWTELGDRHPDFVYAW